MATDTAQEERNLLLDRDARVEAVGDASQFGNPGRRFDRRSPFWIGPLGGLGVGAAYVIAWSVVVRQGGAAADRAWRSSSRLASSRSSRSYTATGCGAPWPWLIVSLAALGRVGGLLAVAIPPLVNQINNLIKQAPHYLQDAQQPQLVSRSPEQAVPPGHPPQERSVQGGLSSITSGVLGAGQSVVRAWHRGS